MRVMGRKYGRAAPPLQREEVVAPADVPPVDEDLRHRGPAVRALDHPVAHIASKIDRISWYATPLASKRCFARQQ